VGHSSVTEQPELNLGIGTSFSMDASFWQVHFARAIFVDSIKKSLYKANWTELSSKQ
jgi:hypothetical protein